MSRVISMRVWIILSGIAAHWTRKPLTLSKALVATHWHCCSREIATVLPRFTCHCVRHAQSITSESLQLSTSGLRRGSAKRGIKHKTLWQHVSVQSRIYCGHIINKLIAGANEEHSIKNRKFKLKAIRRIAVRCVRFLFWSHQFRRPRDSLSRVTRKFNFVNKKWNCFWWVHTESF